MSSKRKIRSGLVLSGGGTRGAYEAGVIHYIRTMLPPRLAQAMPFHILCGSSVGAINVAFMAAMAHEPVFQGQELLRLWRDIRATNIYRRGPVTMSKLFLRTIVGIGAHLLGIKGVTKADDDALHFQGLFDTQPFFQHLKQHCPWPNISKNIESGVVDAVAVTATNMLTGQPEIFLEKNPYLPHSERILTRLGRISPRHVMASAAIPILFPPVRIHEVYYNDGGTRMNAPLAPTVSLGASRVLLIGTRYRPTRAEENTQIQSDAHRPTLAEVLGKVFNSILLDRLDADREQLDRINRVLAACKANVAPEVYEAICTEASVQRIETLSIFPSSNISAMVDEVTRGSFRSLKTVGSFEKFILRLLETDPKRGSDLLSYFLFEPAYLNKLIDLGFEDARTHHDKLAEFAENTLAETPVD